ncbi:hypothetical protein M432DRAFT_71383 [Thermoascus aurantiacus ATCC 26904]
MISSSGTRRTTYSRLHMQYFKLFNVPYLALGNDVLYFLRGKARGYQSRQVANGQRELWKSWEDRGRRISRISLLARAWLPVITYQRQSVRNNAISYRPYVYHPYTWKLVHRVQHPSPLVVGGDANWLGPRDRSDGPDGRPLRSTRGMDLPCSWQLSNSFAISNYLPSRRSALQMAGIITEHFIHCPDKQEDAIRPFSAFRVAGDFSCRSSPLVLERNASSSKIVLSEERQEMMPLIYCLVCRNPLTLPATAVSRNKQTQSP